MNRRRSAWPQRAAAWLLPEERRYTGAGLLAALLAAVVWAVIDGPGQTFVAVSDYLYLFFALLLVAYVVLTWAAFRLGERHRVLTWARGTKQWTWVDAFLRGTAPGVGLGSSVAGLALLAVVLWIPQGAAPADSLPQEVRLVVGVVIVAGAWSTLLLTYAVAYLCQDQRTRGAGRADLDFPHTPGPGWRDYLYLATSVSTTFGATDVQVLTTRMRDLMRSHSVIAFVFNTVILAAVVSLLVSR